MVFFGEGHRLSGFVIAVQLALLCNSAKANRGEHRGGHLAGVGIAQEFYTTNAVCRARHCVNPIFPGLQDLSSLEVARWEMRLVATVRPHLEFCAGIVDYDVGLPAAPAGQEPQSVAQLVQVQDDRAATAFFYHAQGMGLESWELPGVGMSSARAATDELGDPCLEAVRRLSCFTYFPRSAQRLSEGQETTYLRPCKSSCNNYLAACSVECCDDSAQCVFEHATVSPETGTTLVQTGYVDQLGPSAMCTGAASPRRNFVLGIFVAFALMVAQVP